jgi:hypothetical protein
VPLAHNDNRRVGQIHLVIPRHKSAEPRPMFRNLKVQPNRAALEQLKQRIDVHAVCIQGIKWEPFLGVPAESQIASC